MSQERINRRRFLADALFAGGALGAAALAARFMTEKAPPPVVSQPSPKIPCAPPDGPALDGDVANPRFYTVIENGPREPTAQNGVSRQHR